MRCLIATGNAGKVRYYRARLLKEGIEVVTPAELGVHADVEENGSDPAENAAIKALAYARLTGLPVVALDDGLFLDGVPDREQPGTHVKRIHGQEADRDTMLRHYTGLVQMYGHGGKLTGAFLKGAAVARGDDVRSFQYRDERVFTDKVCPVELPGLPLASIQYIERLGKYRSELTPEEEQAEMELSREPLIAFIVKAIGEMTRE